MSEWKTTGHRWAGIRYFRSGADFVVDASDDLENGSYSVDQIRAEIAKSVWITEPSISLSSDGYWDDTNYFMVLCGSRIATPEESIKIAKWEAYREEMNRKARERKKKRDAEAIEKAEKLLRQKKPEVLR